MKTQSSILNHITSLVFLFLLIILLIENIWLTVSAFKNYQLQNQITTEAIIEKIKNNKISSYHTVDQISKLISSIRNASTAPAFESNTISYFFQLFTIALLSAGTYLLVKSKEQINRAMEISNHQAMYNQQLKYVIRMVNIATEIEIIDNFLFDEEDINKYLLKYFPNIREKIQQLFDIINDIRLNKVEITEDYINLLMNVLNKLVKLYDDLDSDDINLIEKLRYNISSISTIMDS